MSRFRSDDAPALIRAADYRPSVPLTAHADEIRERARTHGLGDLRVFGSEVRGEDGFDSDIDLVVTPSAEIDLFDLALFVREVEELTGLPTDAVSDAEMPAILERLRRRQRADPPRTGSDDKRLGAAAESW